MEVPMATFVVLASFSEQGIKNVKQTVERADAFKGRVITYCGGGIAASADALALVMLGHPDVKLYDGSLLEWAADASLPMEVG